MISPTRVPVRERLHGGTALAFAAVALVTFAWPQSPASAQLPNPPGQPPSPTGPSETDPAPETDAPSPDAPATSGDSGGEGDPIDLKLVFAPGDRHRYQIVQIGSSTSDFKPEEGAPQGGLMLRTPGGDGTGDRSVRQLVTLTVEEVDAEGVARVTYAVDRLTYRAARVLGEGTLRYDSADPSSEAALEGLSPFEAVQILPYVAIANAIEPIRFDLTPKGEVRDVSGYARNVEIAFTELRNDRSTAMLAMAVLQAHTDQAFALTMSTVFRGLPADPIRLGATRRIDPAGPTPPGVVVGERSLRLATYDPESDRAVIEEEEEANSSSSWGADAGPGEAGEDGEDGPPAGMGGFGPPSLLQSMQMTAEGRVVFAPVAGHLISVTWTTRTKTENKIPSYGTIEMEMTSEQSLTLLSEDEAEALLAADFLGGEDEEAGEDSAGAAEEPEGAGPEAGVAPATPGDPGGSPMPRR